MNKGTRLMPTQVNLFWKILYHNRKLRDSAMTQVNKIWWSSSNGFLTNLNCAKTPSFQSFRSTTKAGLPTEKDSIPQDESLMSIIFILFFLYKLHISHWLPVFSTWCHNGFFVCICRHYYGHTLCFIFVKCLLRLGCYAIKDQRFS